MNAVLEQPQIAEFDVWAWDGYSSQFVEDKLTRAAVIRASLAARRNDDLERVIAVEDGEHMTVIVSTWRWFYSPRTTKTIYTTRIGALTLDEDDNLRGVWQRS